MPSKNIPFGDNIRFEVRHTDDDKKKAEASGTPNQFTSKPHSLFGHNPEDSAMKERCLTRGDFDGTSWHFIVTKYLHYKSTSPTEEFKHPVKAYMTSGKDVRLIWYSIDPEAPQRPGRDIYKVLGVEKTNAGYNFSVSSIHNSKTIGKTIPSKKLLNENHTNHIVKKYREHQELGNNAHFEHTIQADESGLFASIRPPKIPVRNPDHGSHGTPKTLPNVGPTISPPNTASQKYRDVWPHPSSSSAQPTSTTHENQKRVKASSSKLRARLQSLVPYTQTHKDRAGLELTRQVPLERDIRARHDMNIRARLERDTLYNIFKVDSTDPDPRKATAKTIGCSKNGDDSSSAIHFACTASDLCTVGADGEKTSDKSLFVNLKPGDDFYVGDDYRLIVLSEGLGGVPRVGLSGLINKMKSGGDLKKMTKGRLKKMISRENIKKKKSTGHLKEKKPNLFKGIYVGGEGGGEPSKTLTKASSRLSLRGGPK
ncbi:MAG: hypothetical protein CYPHOPRED_004258 [Cyphobasidiales sp. Tagirdzhanova-0007]|nr:MAG: hypothetical protein CYPHOPRED_004258 [Cyphobasidiales sp. Tagirdzhanova-0007]